jgi:chemotaxis protein methyltransferase CheR
MAIPTQGSTPLRELREFEYRFEDFERLRALSFNHSGIRVPDDKFDMFYSRLAKRLRALGLNRFRDYCPLVEDSSSPEFTEFINAITTNLTSFFRENHHFMHLRDQVLPGLLANNAGTRRIRGWSAGCSTGEEPYSIAMTLLEAAPRLRDWDVKLLATDLDTRVLATATEGVYEAERVRHMDLSRLQRWFLKGGAAQAGRVRVKDELRGLVHFRQLNLIGPWTLKGPFDFIFCRNVLIYFDQPTKTRLVERFEAMLPPGGHLYIGHSESLHTLNPGMESLGQTIYRKTAGDTP